MLVRAWRRIEKNVARLSSKSTAAKSAEPNWNRMMERASSDEEKSAISAARASLLELQLKVFESEKPAVPIDWAKWEQTLSDTALVQEFKTAYNKVKFESDPESDVGAQIKKEHANAIVQVKKLVDEVNGVIKNLEKDQASFENAKQDLRSATVDSVLKKNPDLDAKYNEEIKNDKWF